MLIKFLQQYSDSKLLQQAGLFNSEIGIDPFNRSRHMGLIRIRSITTH